MTPAGKTCRCFYAGEGRADFGAGEGLAGLWGALLFRMASRRGAEGNGGKTQGGLPLGNPVCLWQTELFKLNLKSSPSSSGYNRRRRLAPRSSGKQQAGRTAVRAAPIVCPEESPQCARRRIPLSPVELDAPTPARSGTCRPKGRSHFSFGGERKVCKRKPAARRLREKALYCPFWRRGSLCRAQRSWPAYACYRARSELAFFRRQNGRAFFPPLPIAALPRRSWRVAGLLLASWDASVWLENFAAWMNRLIFFSRAGVGQAYPLRVGMFSCGLGIFAAQKASGISNPRWPFYSSPIK